MRIEKEFNLTFLNDFRGVTIHQNGDFEKRHRGIRDSVASELCGDNREAGGQSEHFHSD